MILTNRLFEHRAPIHLLVFATAALVVPWLSLALSQNLGEGTIRDLMTALSLLFLPYAPYDLPDWLVRPLWVAYPLGLSLLTILVSRNQSAAMMFGVFAILALAGAAVANLLCAVSGLSGLL